MFIVLLSIWIMISAIALVILEEQFYNSSKMTDYFPWKYIEDDELTKFGNMLETLQYSLITIIFLPMIIFYYSWLYIHKFFRNLIYKKDPHG